MVNGDNVPPVDDVSNSIRIDQSPAPRNVEAEPASPAEAKVSGESCPTPIVSHYP